MHVLVATDGTLDIDDAAKFATALAGDDGQITVTTIVRIPRRLVQELRSKYGEQSSVTVDSDAEYVNSPKVENTTTPPGWPGDDSVIDQYLGNKRVEIARPVAELIRSLGGSAESVVREGEDVASDIIDLSQELGVDVVVIGSHGHGAFQGLLGSTGAKLVRRSVVPVLVVR